jgi:hypothetical protein
VSLWEERAGRNEALFRTINEEIRGLQRPSDSSAEIVCECAEADCTSRLQVPVAVYESVRANPRRFLVQPGHERPAVELVVNETDSYLIVEKQSVPGQIAERTDPRS